MDKVYLVNKEWGDDFADGNWTYSTELVSIHKTRESAEIRVKELENEAIEDGFIFNEMEQLYIRYSYGGSIELKVIIEEKEVEE